MKRRSDGRFIKTQRVRGRRLSGYGYTEEEAIQDLQNKVEAELAKPAEPSTHLIVLDSNSPLHTVAKACWYPRIEGKKPRTRARYVSAYVNHIRPELGAVPIGQFAPPEGEILIDRFVATLKKKWIWPNGKAPKNLVRSDDHTHFLGQQIMDEGGARYVTMVLSMILKRAMAHKLIHMNPVPLADVPAQKQKRERVMSIDRARKVFDMLEGHELQLPFFLAAFMGLRRGEVCAFAWEYFDRISGVYRVRKQLVHQDGGGVEEVDVKRDSKRDMDLSGAPSFLALIDKLGDLDHPVRVCTRSDRNTWVPNKLTDAWAEWNKSTGALPDWTFHDLRHGAAGLVYSATKDILAVQALLGHKDVDMSIIYTAQLQEANAKNLSTLDSLFSGHK